MDKEKRRVLEPSIFGRFYCKGEECRYTCCQYWRITMSREEYRRWKKCGILPKGKMGDGKVHLCSEDMKTERHYAEISLTEEGLCPYLDEKGLCQIQKKYGIKEMTATCRIFPREANSYFGQVECSFSMGCEKVLELLLEEKEGLFLKESRPQYFETYNSDYGLSERKKHPKLRSYYDIQTLSLALLQSEEMTMENRLLLLGIALERIDAFYDKGTGDAVAEYIGEFLQMAQQSETGTFLEHFSEDRPLTVYNSVMSALLTLGFPKDFQNNFILKVGKAVESRRNEGIENPDLDYYQKCRETFGHWMKGKEYFFENVMVMCLLWLNIPFYDLEKSLWGNYLYLVWTWVMLKGCLCLSLTKESTDEEMIDCCTVLFRKLGHDRKKFLEIIDAFQKEGDSLTHIAILLRSC